MKKLSAAIWVIVASLVSAPRQTNARRARLKTRKPPSLLLLLAALPVSVLAAGVTGAWKSEFDSQIGTFAWVGAFSAAPNTKPPPELLPDPAAAKARLKLLWLSGGNKDGLLDISQGVHAYLKTNGVPHVWNVDHNGHDATEWRNNFYYFVQRLFR